MTDALGRPRGIVVLGGGSEIGLAIARALVGRGARGVVLAARHPEALGAAVAALRADGAAVEAIGFDALVVDSHGAVVDEAFRRAQALAGDVDVAILAFAVLGDLDPLAGDPAEAGRAAIVNYAGAVSAGLAVAQRLRAQGHGTLVVLSSVAGQRARSANFPYASAKAGLDAFAGGLGDALAGSGARVITVRPGWVRTQMTAGRRAAPFATSAERVAADVVRGIERGERVVWTPGSMRWAALAMRLAPGPLFRLVTRRR